MRIAFCGSGTFAAPVLDAICAAGHDVAAVLTQPARPAGRGGHIRPTPVAERAAEMGLETWTPENVNDPSVVEWLAGRHCDVNVVVEYAQFLKAPVRQAVKLDTINLHASVLPDLRGAAPINWAIIRGHETTGVSTFSLVDKMDAGAVYGETCTPIGPDETAAELRERLAKLGCELVLETIEHIAAGDWTPRPQDESKATFAPRLQKSDGFLTFDQPAACIERCIRGTWPWPGGQATLHIAEGKSIDVTIARARAVDGTPTVPPGYLDDDLCVAAGEGRLEILELKPHGKRAMDWKSFCNGHRPRPRDVFTGPQGARP